MKGKAPWVCAGVFATIHILLVALPVISSGGSGEGQAIRVAILDFPLVFLMLRTHSGACILYGCLEPSLIPYVVFIPVVGTLMYAVFGFLAGVLCRAIFRAVAVSTQGGNHDA